MDRQKTDKYKTMLVPFPEDWQPTIDDIAFATQRGLTEDEVWSIVQDLKTYTKEYKVKIVTTHPEWLWHRYVVTKIKARSPTGLY